MQALNNLALEKATFEQTGANLEGEHSEVDLLFADVHTAMEGLAEAQQHQERLQGKLKSSRENLDAAPMDMKESMSKVGDSRQVHDVVCRHLQAAGTRTFEMKRKADDALDRLPTHRDRCRRATRELETAEEDHNDSLGRLGQVIKDTAEATYALSCGVLDRDSSEARYLQEALDI